MGAGFFFGCLALAFGFYLGCESISNISVHARTLEEIRNWRYMLQRESSAWRKHTMRVLNEDHHA